MYIGGGAVGHEQSYLLGGVVVSCKNWRWAALVYAATRIAGLASNNTLGPLNSGLVIPMDGEDGDLAAATQVDFEQLCEDMFERANVVCCNHMLWDLGKQSRFDRGRRELQSTTVGIQLDKAKAEHADGVSAFLAVPI